MSALVKWIFAALAAWRLFGPVLTPRFPPGQQHPWKIPATAVYVGDREFIVRRVGDPGLPEVVLIHGLGGASLTEWYEVGPLLAEHFHLTIVENRNHGLSPRFTQRYDVADVADDVAAAMEELGLETAHVVGYSMGGTVAQSLAHRHPDRVDQLVLIGTFSFHPPLWRWSRVLGAIVTRAWERLTGTGTPEVRTGYLLATGAVEGRHARFMWEETHRRDPEAGAAASLALFRFDSREWISEVDDPTLVIVPARDQLVPVAWQLDLAARLPNARVLEIPGALHEVVWTHPSEVAAAIAEFLDRRAHTDGSDEPDIEPRRDVGG